MQIKESSNQNKTIHKLKALMKYKLFVILILLVIYSTFLIVLGGLLHKEGFFGEILKPLIQENIRIPGNYIKGITSNPEQLVIDIKHKQYQKLAYKRKLALQEGVLHPLKEDFVPAKIRWKGKTIKVNMRLKGDLGDHWSRDHKWSFRIKAKNNNTIMGMKNFSLQHPRTRGFLNDWHLHKILEHLGFITLRYEFVNVTINGRDLGIYAIEEHFEKRLIENNKHINGPIIRIKDHLLWYLVDPKTGFQKKHLDELYSSSPIDAFNTNTIIHDEKLFDNFKKAKNLLESFRRGELNTHQVFDIDKLSKIFAVIDLFGYRHTTAYSNIRFYYNPITSLLEPIGYDNTFIQIADSIEGQTKIVRSTGDKDTDDRLDWRKTFFEDEIFFNEYIQALYKVSDKRFLDELFIKINDEYEEKLNIIFSNFPGYNFSPQREKLYKNQEFIRKILNPIEGIQAYLKNINNSTRIVTLQIGNIQFLPIEILNAYYGNYKLELLESKTLLQSKTPFQPVNFKEIQFKLPEGLTWQKNITNDRFKVDYRILGSNDVKSVTAFNWTYFDDDFLQTDFIRQKPNFKNFDFIHVDNSEKIIFIKPGKWDLLDNLIIPPGFTLTCRSGTQLNLLNNSKLLSYSPLDFVGTDEIPIIIESSDSSGQGIAILNAKSESTIKNVIFSNLSAPSHDGWELPGAITFYESDVMIHKSGFIKNKNGSSLNIIRSQFNIHNSYFNNSISDLLRIDFSKGKISKSLFTDSKGDGLKILGSLIDIEDITITNTINTGLYIGDKSSTNIKDIIITKAKTAIKSQDSSQADMENVQITTSDLAFFVAQTKSEYGPANINIKNLMTNDINNKYITRDNSSLVIDGIIMN